MPTVGRDSLAATLGSIARQTEALDEVLVCVDDHRDGRYAEVRSLVEVVRRWHFGTWATISMPHEQFGGCWGHRMTNRAFEMYANGTHRARIDDDDIYYPGALAAMREFACERPVIFKTFWGPGHPAHGVTLWREKVVMRGEIATPMVLAPASAARYGELYDGDYEYARQLQDIYGSFEWREELICEVRPC